MPLADFSAFDWDEGNIRKVSERMHCSVAELAFRGTPIMAFDKKHSNGEKRWFLVNRVADRHVFVVCTLRGERVRIITARFMHAKEVKKYEKWFK